MRWKNEESHWSNTSLNIGIAWNYWTFACHQSQNTMEQIVGGVLDMISVKNRIDFRYENVSVEQLNRDVLVAGHFSVNVFKQIQRVTMDPSLTNVVLTGSFFL